MEQQVIRNKTEVLNQSNGRENDIYDPTANLKEIQHLDLFRQKQKESLDHENN